MWTRRSYGDRHASETDDTVIGTSVDCSVLFLLREIRAGEAHQGAVIK